MNKKIALILAIATCAIVGLFQNFDFEDQVTLAPTGKAFYADDQNPIATAHGMSLKFQTDGNLVVYNRSGQWVWAASVATPSVMRNCDPTLHRRKTAGNPDPQKQCFAVFQTDGNFVLYDPLASPWAYWATQTDYQPPTDSSPGGTFRISTIRATGLYLLKHEPFIQIEDASNDILWASSYNFRPGFVLAKNQFVQMGLGTGAQTPPGFLWMAPNGNLALFGSTPIFRAIVGQPVPGNDGNPFIVWQSNTFGNCDNTSNCAAQFQSKDGNFVVYNTVPLFATNTNYLGTTDMDVLIEFSPQSPSVRIVNPTTGHQYYPLYTRPTRMAALAIPSQGMSVAGGGGVCSYQKPMPPEQLCNYNFNRPCITGSFTEADINAALQGPNDVAVLCPGATYKLNNPIQFTASCQALVTQSNQPIPDMGPTADHATVIINNPKITTAILAQGQNNLLPHPKDFSFILISNIAIDGNERNLGTIKNGLVSSGGGLVEMGGYNTHDQHITNVLLQDTRSWSTLHLYEGGGVVDPFSACFDEIVENNIVQSHIAGEGRPSGNNCGQNQDGQNCSDGLSIACRNSWILNNQITDATDGGIVMFGAPNSVVMNNVINTDYESKGATPYNLNGGINMVDVLGFGANYTCNVAAYNQLTGPSSSSGAAIKAGIAVGPDTWGITSKLSFAGNTMAGQSVPISYAHSHGGFVLNNFFSGYFHFAIAVSTADNFTIQNNNAANASAKFTDFGFNSGLVTNSSLSNNTPGFVDGYYSKISNQQ